MAPSHDLPASAECHGIFLRGWMLRCGRNGPPLGSAPIWLGCRCCYVAYVPWLSKTQPLLLSTLGGPIGNPSLLSGAVDNLSMPRSGLISRQNFELCLGSELEGLRGKLFRFVSCVRARGGCGVRSSGRVLYTDPEKTSKIGP